METLPSYVTCKMHRHYSCAGKQLKDISVSTSCSLVSPVCPTHLLFVCFLTRLTLQMLVMVSVRLPGRVSERIRNLNIAVFSDTLNVINVKPCMMVLFIELYPLIPLSAALSIFLVTAGSNSFN